MNIGVRVREKTLATSLSLLITIGALAGIVGQGGRLPAPNGEFNSLPASVVIKTQDAADSVPNGIRGIDVSEYQGSINWAKVATDDVKYTMIRATVGEKADKYFTHNAQKAHENGLLVGAYHYMKFTDEASMKKEAKLFIQQLKKVEITYPVALDVEANRGMNRTKLTELCVQFMDMVRDEGYTVMFYSYNNFIRDHINRSGLGDYQLWVANYMEEPSMGQKQWQHTSYGSVSGITGRVDINIAYEDLATSKKVRVNRAVSDSIKRTLNERHGSGLSEEGLDMVAMKEAVVTALQSELNRQMQAGLAVTGVMDAETLNAVEKVPFTYNETKGNMTYLMQVMLFYSGCYTQDLTGAYDDHTVTALKSFQTKQGISVTGAPDRDTLWYLFH